MNSMGPLINLSKIHTKIYSNDFFFFSHGFIQIFHLLFIQMFFKRTHPLFENANMNCYKNPPILFKVLLKHLPWISFEICCSFLWRFLQKLSRKAAMDFLKNSSIESFRNPYENSSRKSSTDSSRKRFLQKTISSGVIHIFCEDFFGSSL